MRHRGVLGWIMTVAVVAPAAAAAPGQLTLAEAVRLGVEHNLAAVLGREQAVAARAAAREAKARLLPQLGATVSGSRSKIDLEAYGFPVAPGESPLIGPFNVVDGRLTASMPLLDLSAGASAHAAASRADAAAAGEQDAAAAVAAAVSSLYLRAAAGRSRVEAAEAQVATAEALLGRARAMEEAGTVAGIEVLRAQVQLAAEQQRLIVARNDTATATLALAQAVGLPMAEELAVADALPETPLPDVDLGAALEQARSRRADLRAARAAVRAAEASVSAAHAARLPSMRLAADIGRIGPDAGALETTYDARAVVAVPLFTGGAMGSRSAAAASALRREQARLTDLDSRVELQIRSAVLDVKAAADQTRVAREAETLAAEQLTQAEDRFSAGVASGIEVVQAQDAVAAAHERVIAGRLAYDEAKIALARALGMDGSGIVEMLGGSQ